MGARNLRRKPLQSSNPVAIKLCEAEVAILSCSIVWFGPREDWKHQGVMARSSQSNMCSVSCMGRGVVPLCSFCNCAVQHSCSQAQPQVTSEQSPVKHCTKPPLICLSQAKILSNQTFSPSYPHNIPDSSKGNKKL